MKYYDFIGVFFIGAMGAGKRNIYKYWLYTKCWGLVE